VRWQPVSPSLMAHLQHHAEERHAPFTGQLLRYRDGRLITARRYDHLWHRIGQPYRGWRFSKSATIGWDTTLTWVERNLGTRWPESTRAISAAAAMRALQPPTSEPVFRKSPRRLPHSRVSRIHWPEQASSWRRRVLKAPPEVLLICVVSFVARLFWGARVWHPRQSW
jgi:hypothetical protein